MLVNESVLEKVKRAIEAHVSICDLCIDLLCDDYEQSENGHIANALDELMAVK